MKPNARVRHDAVRHTLQPDCNTERLRDTEADRQIPSPLGDLAAPEFAFFLELFEGRNDHRQQLQNDGRRDIRHDAQGENGQTPDVAAREEIEKAEDRSLRAGEKLVPAVNVDSGRRYETA